MDGCTCTKCLALLWTERLSRADYPFRETAIRELEILIRKMRC